MGTALLSANNLLCERDDRLLFSNLSFELCSGDILQLEGPNGAGKTTLLRILSGLFSNFEGQVCWNGQSTGECYTEYQQNLLYIGHKSAIKTTLTPLENLQFLLRLKESVAEEKLWQALEKVGLAGFESVLCKNLSAGQQRRVALARLYLSTAKIWVLDEIFTAIDKAGVAQLEALLAEKAKEGVAIVLTTHHELVLPNVRCLRLGRTR